MSGGRVSSGEGHLPYREGVCHMGGACFVGGGVLRIARMCSKAPLGLAGELHRFSSGECNALDCHGLHCMKVDSVSVLDADQFAVIGFEDGCCCSAFHCGVDVAEGGVY